MKKNPVVAPSFSSAPAVAPGFGPASSLVLVPEKPVAGGSMLARHEGRIVFVRGAIPGESVRVRVERVSKAVAHAVVVEVVEPHPDRRVPSVDPACGGNAFAHVVYARQLLLKGEIVSDAFARIAGIRLERPVPVMASPERGYRMRARLHVRGRRAGFYRERTHDLCDAVSSGQLQPAAVDAVQAVVAAWHDASGPDAATDGIAGIELGENAAADERAVHLELREGVAARPDVLGALGSIGGLSGVSWSTASDPRTQIAAGSPYVTDTFDPGPGDPAQGQPPVARLRRHVRSFFQANRYLLFDLVDRVRSLVPPGPVVDLYAGVGLFAVALASSRRDEVAAVEGDVTSALDLEANAAACVRPFATHHQSVEAYLDAAALPPGTVVLDPPRTGLSRDAMRGLVRHEPAQIVYVSCDVATLARDVRRLTQDGYRLAHVEAFDLFPNTAHIETVVSMERR
jgi:23S rRNA (uracil1939-C5)-methyltransferase